MDNITPIEYKLKLDTSQFKDNFKFAEQTARDTGKKIDPELKKKLELDISMIQYKLKEAKDAIKKATSIPQKIILQADINQLQRSLTEAKREMNNLLNTGDTAKSRLGNLFESVSGSAKNILGGLGIAVGLQQIIGYFNTAKEQARDFQHEMSLINTVLNVSYDKLSKLGEQVLKLSNTYGVATKEIQQLMFEVASSGYGIENVPKMAELAVRGAVATGESAVDIFKGVNSVIKAYGLNTQEATSIADKFFQANIQGQFTVGDLSREIQGVVASANILGVSLDELLAGFTLFTGVIGTTSEVGTGLQRTFDSLSSPSKEALDTLKEYGISYSHIQEILSKPTDQGGGYLVAVKNITDALHGNNLALGKVFDNINAYKVATSIATMSTEEFKKSIDGIKNSTGAMDNAIAKFVDSEDFKMKVAEKQWENFKTKVGNVVLTATVWVISMAEKIGASFMIIGNMLSRVVGAMKSGTENISQIFTWLGNGLLKVFKRMEGNAITAGKNLFSGIYNNLAGLGEGVSNIMNKVIGSIEGMVNKAIDGLNSIKEIVNKIPGVNLGDMKHISLGRISVDSVNKKDYESFSSFGGFGRLDIKEGVGTDWMNGAKNDILKYGKILSNDNSIIKQRVMGDFQDEMLRKLQNTKDIQDTTSGSGKKGETSEQKAKKELEAKVKAINDEADAQILALSKTEEEKKKNAEKIIKIDAERERKIKDISGKSADNQIADAKQIVEETKKAQEEASKYIKEYYGDINKAIENSKEKVRSYADAIKDTQKQIADLTVDTNKSIADRVVEINKELAKSGEDAVDSATKAKLEAEKSLAFQGLTPEEQKNLNDLISKATLLDSQGEIGKIKADFEEKKTLLQKDLLEKQASYDKEKAIFDELTKAKEDFEKRYTTTLQQEVQKQKASLDDLINKMREAASVGSITGFGNTVVNNYTNSNNNNNSNNSTTTNSNNTSTAIIKPGSSGDVILQSKLSKI